MNHDTTATFDDAGTGITRGFTVREPINGYTPQHSRDPEYIQTGQISVLGLMRLLEHRDPNTSHRDLRRTLIRRRKGDDNFDLRAERTLERQHNLDVAIRRHPATRAKAAA